MNVRLITWLLATTMMVLPLVSFAQEFQLADLLLTPDQQGRRLMERGEFDQAAVRFTDPMRRGVALYRAGEFEMAAASFGRISSPEAAFNRGNALVFMGQYDQAIASYTQALQMQPAWTAAIENRSIAEARAAALAPPDDDYGGTGGMLEADEIVIDETGRTSNAQGEEVTDGGPTLSDQELQALWLRRVDTRPADFLQARFAQQLRVQAVEVEE
jgi:Ca-activated chloride channel family protein